jgi:hypothetical protein
VTEPSVYLAETDDGTVVVDYFDIWSGPVPDSPRWIPLAERVEDADVYLARVSPESIAEAEERHAGVDDVELRTALVQDDLAEDFGMHGDDRQTCGRCQVWATDEHLESEQHWQGLLW